MSEIHRPTGPQHTHGRYAVIPRTLIFLEQGGGVLLLRGSAHKWFAGKYNGLGGHVEPGEDVYTAAVREVEEEAGVRAEELVLRAVVHVTGFDPGVMLFVFRGSVSGQISPSSAEGSLEWVPLDDLDRYPLLPDLRWLLPRVFDDRIPFVFATFEVTEEHIVVRTPTGEQVLLSREAS